MSCKAKSSSHTAFPLADITHHIWPDRTTPNDDRILNQMAYLHPYNSTQKLKTILVYNGLRDGMREGQTSFKKLKCPVDRCVLTSIREKAATADLILWQEHLSKPAVARPPHQIWMVSQALIQLTSSGS